MRNCLWKSLLPVGLCFSIAFDGFLPQAYAQTLPIGINIVVVAGENAVNKVHQKVSRDPAVRVENDDHQPISGAVVVFALPTSGASGEFADGGKTLTVITDQKGMAAAHGLRTNDVPGKLQIYVTASFRGMRARGLINQVIEGPAGRTPTADSRGSRSGGGTWKWILLGVVAAGGAGAGFYFQNRNSNSSSPISVSTGTVSFGSPR